MPKTKKHVFTKKYLTKKLQLLKKSHPLQMVTAVVVVSLAGSIVMTAQHLPTAITTFVQSAAKHGAATSPPVAATGTVSAGNNAATSGGAAPSDTKTTPGAATTTGASSSPTTAPAVTPPPPPAAPHISGVEKFGMSAPANLWATRLSDVGGPSHIKYRRIYHPSGFGENLNLEAEAQAAGMIPVISFKTGNYSWAQVAAGAADADLQAVVAKLNAIPGPKYVSIHHEPNGDGTAADWSAMNTHALPILKNANNVQVGVIGNGWWWSSRAQGLSDPQIADWIPNSLKAVCDFIAADTYEDAGQLEDGAVKMTNMAAWARRTGGVSSLGVAEFNGFSAASITHVMNVAKAEPLFKWALVWNSDTSGTLGSPLTGARLDAFKAGLATTDPT